MTIGRSQEKPLLSVNADQAQITQNTISKEKSRYCPTQSQMARINRRFSEQTQMQQAPNITKDGNTETSK